MSSPKGWTQATIGDFALPKVEQGPPTHRVNYVDIGAIDRDRKVIGAVEKVDARTAPTRARQWIQAGDVLVSMTRPNLNAVAIVPDGLAGAVASTGFDVLRTYGVLAEWLFARVRSREFVNDICQDVQGVVYPAVRPDDIRRHTMPIPPLPEQRRIIDTVDSLLSRLDAAVAGLEQAQKKLKAYRASVLKSAVEGRLVPTEAELARTENRTYEPAQILLDRILNERRHRWEEGELARLKKAGKAPKDDKWKAKYKTPASPDTRRLPELPDGWCWAGVDQVGRVQLGRQRTPAHHRGPHMRPYLRVANVFEDRLDLSDVKEMNFTPADFETFRLEFGDILLNEGQSPHLIGRPAMYRGEVPGACFQNTLIRFQAFTGLDRRFALVVFRAYLHGRRFLKEAQITTNIAHLGAGRFASIEFPVPPADEQERICDEVERLMSVADTVDTTLISEAVRTRGLRQSVLKWAFEGRLVDQDHTDEPADQLLARIRAERTAVPVRKARAPKTARKKS